MNEPVEKPSATRRKPAGDEDGPEDGSAADASRLGRLKRRMGAGLVIVLAVGIAFLTKLKARAGDSEEPEERQHVEPAPAPQAEAAPLPRRRLRGFLVMLGVVLVAGILGMGSAYSLLSTTFKDQSAKLESQRQELGAFELQEQGQAVKLAELMKKLDAERTKRLEVEKQLGELDVKGLEAEAKEGAAQLAKPQQRKEEGGSAGRLRPSQASTFRAPAPSKIVDCNLVGGDAGALKRCLDDFNRK